LFLKLECFHPDLGMMKPRHVQCVSIRIDLAEEKENNNNTKCKLFYFLSIFFLNLIKQVLLHILFLFLIPSNVLFTLR
jgi:hypothetical protein